MRRVEHASPAGAAPQRLGQALRSTMIAALCACIAAGGFAQELPGLGAPPQTATPLHLSGNAAPAYESIVEAVRELAPLAPVAGGPGGQQLPLLPILERDPASALVQRVVVEVDRDGIPADGQSPVQLTIRVYGDDDQPRLEPVMVTIEHTGGRLLLPEARTDEFGPGRLDADRVVPGVQLRVVGGAATVTLLAPAMAQDVTLRVKAGSRIAQGTLHFVPELRPMVAAGLVEGVVMRGSRLSMQPLRPRDGFEQAIERWSRSFDSDRSSAAARAAFYLKGTVRGDVLLSAAYDSDKPTRARMLRDIRPDEFYPVYGDASLKSADARSKDRVYVRLDKERSYVLWGDFVTGDGFTQMTGQGRVASQKLRSLGAYNRSATGAQAHHETAGMVANAFAFHDSLRSIVGEFASQGSGPYGLRHNAVLEGSEKVEIVVRDRNQPTRVLRVRPLVPMIDYRFEPFSGRIILNEFLPSVDSDLNPVSLRVSYEVDQGGDAFWVGGADAQFKLGDSLEVGGSAVHEANPLAPYRLLSGNAAWRINDSTTLVVEAAQTTSTVNTNPANRNASPGLAGIVGEATGRAARVELSHQDERSELKLFGARSGAAFNNPSAPLAAARDELSLKAGHALTPALWAYAEGWRSADRRDDGGDRRMLGAGLRWQPVERLTIDAGVRRFDETTGAIGNGYLMSPFGLTEGLTGSLASGSAGGALGWGTQALDPATGLPLIQQGSLPPAPATLPAGTRLRSDSLRLGVGWRATDKLSLGATVEASVAGDARRRVALGADYEVFERTRIYGRYERQGGWVQMAGVTGIDRRAGAFAFGVESSHFKDTQLFSEYRLRDAISGRDLQVATGIRQSLEVAEGWRLSFGGEDVRVLAGRQAPTRALFGGVEWSADPLWRASTRLEWRRSGDIAGTPDNERFDTTLWQALVARKLDRDWTLLGRSHALWTRYAARGNVMQLFEQVGVAYRDTDTNRVNALGKLEHKTERDASNAAAGALASRAWIASLHADWHPSRPWWTTGHLAGKWQRDTLEHGVRSSFKAALASGRVVYDISERWDIGALAAVMAGQHGARQTALGVEIGYQLATNLWLSAGFNATGFKADADLAGYEYTQRGTYLRLRFKFDEKLFQGSDKHINRSLER